MLTTQISIFAIYLALRVFALITHSPETSDLAFDILATCACILFPRLVFFLIKDNVVVLAVGPVNLRCPDVNMLTVQLRAMLAQYLNFMALSCERLCCIAYTRRLPQLTIHQFWPSVASFSACGRLGEVHGR